MTAISTDEGPKAVKQVSLLFSCAFLLAVPFAVLHTGETDVLGDWMRILTSPCPLITDYFMLGSLPSAFLNAGVCGIVCTAFFYGTDHGQLKGSNLAGYFLVVAHCFYGLNFLNMWPPVLGIFLYCLWSKQKFSDFLDVAMFSTAFGPFVSELIFRFPLQVRVYADIGGYAFNLTGVVVSLLLGVFLGVSIPAILPGSKDLHKGFDLYNAGLAFGFIGLFLYAFLFKTFGYENAYPVERYNPTYLSFSQDYFLFCNCFYAVVFSICLIYGFMINKRSFKGYGKMLSCSGLETDFLRSFKSSLTWINIGVYGLCMTIHFDALILFTDGAGWTGPTCGIILAAITFSASGQHPMNVWPILVGYSALYLFESLICSVLGRSMVWTLSSQSYMNGAAFATGLCPFAGYFGPFSGILVGFVNAVLCTATSQIHGGFVLYNGGFTAGLTAIMVSPVLLRYRKSKKQGL